MARVPKVMDPEQRTRANQRERRRVSEMNSMFDVLLNLLPPSRFKVRLSRAQILREAINYIFRLSQYLESSEVDDPFHQKTSQEAFSLFPHIFNQERISNKDAYRRPMKLKEGGVAAFISRHDLPKTPVETTEFAKPAVVPFTQTNVYIAYF